MMPRLLCVGLTTLDIAGRTIDRIPAGGGTSLIDGIALSPAGTAGGMALVAARLGVPVAIASAVGDDAAGRFLRSEFAREQVDTTLLAVRVDKRTSTTMLTIRGDGERPNFHALGAATFMDLPPSVTTAARNARFVHWGGVGGVNLDGGPGAALLAAARGAGAVVTRGLIRPGPRPLTELERLLPNVDYFMPNGGEALSLTGEHGLAKAAGHFLRMGAGACVFKRGADGASYFAGDGAQRDFPAHAVTPVDTTSCGDSFCAGFVAALDRGHTVDEACRFAMATAALVASDLGTVGKVASFAATWDAMINMPLARHATN